MPRRLDTDADRALRRAQVLAAQERHRLRARRAVETLRSLADAEPPVPAEQARALARAALADAAGR